MSGFIPESRPVCPFCIIWQTMARAVCRVRRAVLAVFGFPAVLCPQVIEFQSSGLDYQVLTRQGLTVMCAAMSLRTSRYSLLHVAVSNGSDRPWVVGSQAFTFEYDDGSTIRAVPEQRVIDQFFRNAGRSELLKLQRAYEGAILDNRYARPNNGYEKRRLSALAMGAKGLRASAAAAAIAFVSGKLHPGDSTDGAMFFSTSGRGLKSGRIIARVEGETFEFLAR